MTVKQRPWLAKYEKQNPHCEFRHDPHLTSVWVFVVGSFNGPKQGTEEHEPGTHH